MASPRWCARAWARSLLGQIFIFRAKRADRVKLLAWDGTGLVLVCKRLEKSVSLAADQRRRDAADLLAALGAG